MDTLSNVIEPFPREKQLKGRTFAYRGFVRKCELGSFAPSISPLFEPPRFSDIFAIQIVYSARTTACCYYSSLMEYSSHGIATVNTLLYSVLKKNYRKKIRSSLSPSVNYDCTREKVAARGRCNYIPSGLQL